MKHMLFESYMLVSCILLCWLHFFWLRNEKGKGGIYSVKKIAKKMSEIVRKEV